jgi:hypothetical protein
MQSINERDSRYSSFPNLFLNKNNRPSEKAAAQSFLRLQRATGFKKNAPAAMTPVDITARLAAQRLQNIDGAVRAHEQAHLSAIAGYARGLVHYTYTVGPDGILYATGGSIQVDLSPVPGDPEATIRKAEAILRAAFSPLEPSSADLQTAAAAYRLEMDAERELKAQKQEVEEKGAEKRQISIYA